MAFPLRGGDYTTFLEVVIYVICRREAHPNRAIYFDPDMKEYTVDELMPDDAEFSDYIDPRIYRRIQVERWEGKLELGFRDTAEVAKALRQPHST